MTISAPAADAADGTDPASHPPPVRTRALIIGTGFSGLGMGIALQQHGVDYLILEKADEVGGTWRDNTYPGCACDVPTQIHCVTEAIKAVDAAGAQAIAPRREDQDAFNEELQRKLAGSVWNTGGCQSWYLDERGYNRTVWSGFTWQYWLSTRSVKLGEYQLTGIRPPSKDVADPSLTMAT